MGPPGTVASTSSEGVAVTFWHVGVVVVEFWMTVYIDWHPPVTPFRSNLGTYQKPKL